MADIYSNLAPEGVATKYCSGCKSDLIASCFHKNKSTKDGLQGLCKQCSKEGRKNPDPDSIERTRQHRRLARERGVKACATCQEQKPLTSDCWAKASRGLGGFSARCKECERASYWAKKSPDYIAKLEEVDRLRAEGRKRCPACLVVRPLDRFIKRKQGSGVYSYCLECYRAQSNERRLGDIDADREKKLKSWRKRKAENGAAMNAQRNTYRRNRIKTDPVFALECRVRGLIGSSVKRMGYTKRSRSYQILGCDWPSFAAHIEKQFTKGMRWERMDEIHIDHIIPISSAKTEDEVIALNHFTNLRPMWAKDNMAKGADRTHLI